MIFVEALLVFVIIAVVWLLITLMMFKKLNKTRTKGVLLILLAFIGVAAVIFTVGHFLEWHETNEFCADMCHSMKVGPYESYTNPKNNTMMETHLEEDVPCAQCHAGPGIIGLGKSFLPVPSEMLHEYVLGYDPDDFGGHVPAENCIKGCHEEAGVDWKFEAPLPQGEGYQIIDGELEWKTKEIYHPLTENGSDLEELKKLETCLECHDARDNSFGFAAEACHVCHDIEDEEMEAHGESTCAMATCHRDKDGNPVQPKLTGHNTVIDHCMECHARDHPEDAFVPYTLTNSKGTTLTVNSSFCSDCHLSTYEEFKVTGEGHYQENDCTECHLEHKTRPDCLDCHDESGGQEPKHPIDSPYDDCTNCHNSAHDPKTITFQVQSASRDFCANVSCHGGSGQIVPTFENYGFKHQENIKNCTDCHTQHKEEEELDCFQCHGQTGIAPLPDHNITNQYADCSICHEYPHAPLNITLEATSIQSDFCSGTSCHGGPDSVYSQFEEFGDGHRTEYPKCNSCHDSHFSFIDDYADELSCIDSNCHSSSPSKHVGPYTKDDCLSCHNSPHDPNNREPTLGSALSQRDYMSQYFEMDIASVRNSFAWVNRGNHRQYGSCSQCHASAEMTIYPSAFKPMLNQSGVNCASGCHGWIDPTTTGKPFDLLTESGNPFSGHQIGIFENSTLGGCGGTCHQADPSAPDYSGSGHGIVTSCLDSGCHGPGFDNFGPVHVNHTDMLGLTGETCGEICHRPISAPTYGEPIDGGCYDCHKSGHNPRILSTSSCYVGSGCHQGNQP